MNAPICLLDFAQRSMQSPDIFLLPLTFRHYFSAIEIQQIHVVVPPNLQIVGIQIGVKYAGLMKAVQSCTKVLPELLITGPLCDAVSQ